YRAIQVTSHRCYLSQVTELHTKPSLTILPSLAGYIQSYTGYEPQMLFITGYRAPHKTEPQMLLSLTSYRASQVTKPRRLQSYTGYEPQMLPIHTRHPEQHRLPSRTGFVHPVLASSYPTGQLNT
ncbi:Hypothetical predicted protein, partial [Olea europaea subsp. europaea]